MTSLPLIAHTTPGATFAWRDGEPLDAACYVADVARLADLLPPRQHLLNVCADRYRFAVGLGAALVRGQVTLMPPNHTPATVAQLLDYAPDAYCLHDGDDHGIAMPGLAVPAPHPEMRAEAGSALVVPQIEVAQVCAVVFTSGSTGRPEPHVKRWGPLVTDVAGEAQRLGLIDDPQRTLVATVPPQHMYGFESSLLVAMQSGAAFDAGRPFFAADICAALDKVAGRRVLVTTPFHLRALLAESASLPALDMIVCATAPLSPQLAREAERRSGAPLLEIYGCTESGQLASRRPVLSNEWEPWPGVRVETRDGRAWASGGHVEQPTPLADVIEVHADGRFSLLGRSADMVNIAGKRTSLAYLSHELNSIPGVEDGVFLMPDEAAEDGIARLAAIVVAPGMPRASLMTALRVRIDPVFLPRPLVFVDALPRAATGKLPREALLALLKTRRLPDREGDGP